MNILLLHPEFPDTFWSFKHALKFIGKRAALPPLGLLTVAAMLPREWAVRLVDLNVRVLTDKDLAWADLAMIGGMAVQELSARELIRRCHEKGLPIVAGGPLFTCEPDAFPTVDHLVLGEAEATLPRFLADFARGAAARVYRPEGFVDITTTPAPRWELAELKRYHSMSVQYSRGCPFRCDFCNVTALFGHRPRVKAPAQVLAELDGLAALGWRGSVFFVDDNLIGNQRALREALLPALIDWRRGRRGVEFYTEASINLADDAALTRQLVDAGFSTVFIGIETPSAEALGECGKRHNLGRDLVADVKRLQRAGLEVQGGFIVGFDSDTDDIFQRQADFIQRSGITTAMVGLLQAPTGTALFARLKGEGRLRGAMSGDNTDDSTNIIPKMPLQRLQAGYRRLMAQLYAPSPYYRRVRTFLREYRPAPARRPLRFGHWMALGRSTVRLGILGRERFHYWYLLAWAALRRPRAFPQAVTLAIHGHHFRRIFARHLDRAV